MYPRSDHPGVVTRGVTVSGVLRYVRVGVQHCFELLGQNAAIGALLAVLLVAGIVLAATKTDLATVRQRLAIPAGLAVGAVAFLAFSGYGRIGLVGSDYAKVSRYQYIVAALLIPIIAFALNEFAARWRVALPFVCALLLVGIPGNVDALHDYTRSLNRRVYNDGVDRHLLLVMAHSDFVRDVPAEVRPYPQRFDTVSISAGWLRGGANSGRIPSPGSVSRDDRARARFRLSLWQRPGNLATATNCRPAGAGLRLHLQRGDRIFFGAFAGLKFALARGPGRGESIAYNTARGNELVAVLGPLDLTVTDPNARAKNRLVRGTVCDVKK
jgi:hypothetical protein